MNSRFFIQTRFAAGLRFTLCILLLALFQDPCPAAANPPVRVLIFTGQNNHDWRATTPVLKEILTRSGRFTVDVTEHPETCDAATFSRYDVLLSNWNTYGSNATVKEWPPLMREAFVNFIRNGGGFVVVHAGGASFHDWADYQKIIGGTWGALTGHGPVHEFEVKFTEADHPVTRGLTPFKTKDELWHRMELQPDKTVLATAFSAPDKHGTGRDEPVVLVTQFGKGRCFNLVLGHNVDAMQSPGFQTLLLRGTGWAATGTVLEENK
jgi:type 1 glutamine amidotransferase